MGRPWKKLEPRFAKMGDAGHDECEPKYWEGTNLTTGKMSPKVRVGRKQLGERRKN